MHIKYFILQVEKKYHTLRIILFPTSPSQAFEWYIYFLREKHFLHFKFYTLNFIIYYSYLWGLIISQNDTDIEQGAKTQKPKNDRRNFQTEKQRLKISHKTAMEGTKR